MIIYPPIIADTIPAFTEKEIKIPFVWNPAVGLNEVKSFRLWVKDQLSTEKFTLTYNLKTGERITDYITFDISNIILDLDEEHRLIPGDFYKIQLGWSDQNSEDDNSTYTFSTVAIGRYIQTVPNYIFNLNTYSVSVTNLMENERIYSYRFKFYEKDNDTLIIQDTGELLNTSNIEISGFIFDLRYELENNKFYTLDFSIKTLNGYEETVKFEDITKPDSITICPVSIKPELDQTNYENGNITIIIGGDNTGAQDCAYIVERLKEGEILWDKLIELSFDSLPFVLRDQTVEQNVNYTYSIRYKDDLYSRNKTRPIAIDFEDMFLSDGERQLKIKFNPQVSGFKTVIQEQKTDTLGSQFPFFFRNGNIGYKEIPISGLISYLMDDNGMFFSSNRNKQHSSQLTGSNIKDERQFKLEVLSWLSNGKPKYFRSPTEGNYLVRLMNVSLSPQATLGRMLHTFQATAYEMDSNDFSALQKNEMTNISYTPVSVLGFFILGESKMGGQRL